MHAYKVLLWLSVLIQSYDLISTESEVEKKNVSDCPTTNQVCGSDGITYENICAMQNKSSELTVINDGECKKKSKPTKAAYRPDLILKSKIVDNENKSSLQKKLVKHFNPVTGKWEYVVEILPTIVITPTFHRLKLTKETEQTSDQTSENNLPSQSLGQVIQNLNLNSNEPDHGPHVGGHVIDAAHSIVNPETGIKHILNSVSSLNSLTTKNITVVNVNISNNVQSPVKTSSEWVVPSRKMGGELSNAPNITIMNLNLTTHQYLGENPTKGLVQKTNYGDHLIKSNRNFNVEGHETQENMERKVSEDSNGSYQVSGNQINSQNTNFNKINVSANAKHIGQGTEGIINSRNVNVNNINVTSKAKHIGPAINSFITVFHPPGGSGTAGPSDILSNNVVNQNNMTFLNINMTGNQPSTRGSMAHEDNGPVTTPSKWSLPPSQGSGDVINSRNANENNMKVSTIAKHIGQGSEGIINSQNVNVNNMQVTSSAKHVGPSIKSAVTIVQPPGGSSSTSKILSNNLIKHNNMTFINVNLTGNQVSSTTPVNLEDHGPIRTASEWIKPSRHDSEDIINSREVNVNNVNVSSDTKHIGASIDGLVTIIHPPGGSSTGGASSILSNNLVKHNNMTFVNVNITGNPPPSTELIIPEVKGPVKTASEWVVPSKKFSEKESDGPNITIVNVNVTAKDKLGGTAVKGVTTVIRPTGLLKPIIVRKLLGNNPIKPENITVINYNITRKDQEIPRTTNEWIVPPTQGTEDVINSQNITVNNINVSSNAKHIGPSIKSAVTIIHPPGGSKTGGTSNILSSNIIKHNNMTFLNVNVTGNPSPLGGYKVPENNGHVSTPSKWIVPPRPGSEEIINSRNVTVNNINVSSNAEHIGPSIKSAVTIIHPPGGSKTGGTSNILSNNVVKHNNMTFLNVNITRNGQPPTGFTPPRDNDHLKTPSEWSLPSSLGTHVINSQNSTVNNINVTKNATHVGPAIKSLVTIVNPSGGPSNILSNNVVKHNNMTFLNVNVTRNEKPQVLPILHTTSDSLVGNNEENTKNEQESYPGQESSTTTIRPEENLKQQLWGNNGPVRTDSEWVVPSKENGHKLMYTQNVTVINYNITGAPQNPPMTMIQPQIPTINSVPKKINQHDHQHNITIINYNLTHPEVPPPSLRPTPVTSTSEWIVPERKGLMEQQNVTIVNYNLTGTPQNSPMTLVPVPKKINQHNVNIINYNLTHPEVPPPSLRPTPATSTSEWIVPERKGLMEQQNVTIVNYNITGTPQNPPMTLVQPQRPIINSVPKKINHHNINIINYNLTHPEVPPPSLRPTPVTSTSEWIVPERKELMKTQNVTIVNYNITGKPQNPPMTLIQPPRLRPISLVPKVIKGNHNQHNINIINYNLTHHGVPPHVLRPMAVTSSGAWIVPKRKELMKTQNVTIVNYNLTGKPQNPPVTLIQPPRLRPIISLLPKPINGNHNQHNINIINYNLTHDEVPPQTLHPTPVTTSSEWIVPERKDLMKTQNITIVNYNITGTPQNPPKTLIKPSKLRPIINLVPKPIKRIHFKPNIHIVNYNMTDHTVPPHSLRPTPVTSSSEWIVPERKDLMKTQNITIVNYNITGTPQNPPMALIQPQRPIINSVPKKINQHKVNIINYNPTHHGVPPHRLHPKPVISTSELAPPRNELVKQQNITIVNYNITGRPQNPPMTLIQPVKLKPIISLVPKSITGVHNQHKINFINSNPTHHGVPLHPLHPKTVTSSGAWIVPERKELMKPQNVTIVNYNLTGKPQNPPMTLIQPPRLRPIISLFPKPINGIHSQHNDEVPPQTLHPTPVTSSSEWIVPQRQELMNAQNITIVNYNITGRPQNPPMTLIQPPKLRPILNLAPKPINRIHIKPIIHNVNYNVSHHVNPPMTLIHAPKLRPIINLVPKLINRIEQKINIVNHNLTHHVVPPFRLHPTPGISSSGWNKPPINELMKQQNLTIANYNITGRPQSPPVALIQPPRLRPIISLVPKPINRIPSQRNTNIDNYGQTHHGVPPHMIRPMQVVSSGAWIVPERKELMKMQNITAVNYNLTGKSQNPPMALIQPPRLRKIVNLAPKPINGIHNQHNIKIVNYNQTHHGAAPHHLHPMPVISSKGWMLPSRNGLVKPQNLSIVNYNVTGRPQSPPMTLIQPLKLRPIISLVPKPINRIPSQRNIDIDNYGQTHHGVPPPHGVRPMQVVSSGALIVPERKELMKMKNITAVNYNLTGRPQSPPMALIQPPRLRPIINVVSKPINGVHKHHHLNIVNPIHPMVPPQALHPTPVKTSSEWMVPSSNQLMKLHKLEGGMNNEHVNSDVTDHGVPPHSLHPTPIITSSDRIVPSRELANELMNAKNITIINLNITSPEPKHSGCCQNIIDQNMVKKPVPVNINEEEVRSIEDISLPLESISDSLISESDLNKKHNITIKVNNILALNNSNFNMSLNNVTINNNLKPELTELIDDKLLNNNLETIIKHNIKSLLNQRSENSLSDNVDNMSIETEQQLPVLNENDLEEINDGEDYDENDSRWGSYHVKLPERLGNNVGLMLNWHLLGLNKNQQAAPPVNVTEELFTKKAKWNNPLFSDGTVYKQYLNGELAEVGKHVTEDNGSNDWNAYNKNSEISADDNHAINVDKSMKTVTYQLNQPGSIRSNFVANNDYNDGAINNERNVYLPLTLPTSENELNSAASNVLEKSGKYTVDLPGNLAKKYKLMMKWSLDKRPPKNIQTPINVTENKVKFNYNWDLLDEKSKNLLKQGETNINGKVIEMRPNKENIQALNSNTLKKNSNKLHKQFINMKNLYNNQLLVNRNTDDVSDDYENNSDYGENKYHMTLERSKSGKTSGANYLGVSLYWDDNSKGKQGNVITYNIPRDQIQRIQPPFTPLPLLPLFNGFLYNNSANNNNNNNNVQQNLNTLGRGNVDRVYLPN